MSLDNWEDDDIPLTEAEKLGIGSKLESSGKRVVCFETLTWNC